MRRSGARLPDEAPVHPVAGLAAEPIAWRLLRAGDTVALLHEAIHLVMDPRLGQRIVGGRSHVYAIPDRHGRLHSTLIFKPFD
jgi:hypothetical protein